MHKPIGMFDSGVGGTSIWKEINLQLPNESTIYLADSKNAPYGEKSQEEILRLSIKNTELLLQMGAKLIVVACNTATTNAIGYLRANYPVPFIGIEPAIKPAALQTQTKRVGVLATKGTLSSNLFYNTTKLYAAGIEVYEQEGKGLVQLVEAGLENPIEIKKVLLEILSPMLAENMDCLVLGCTHYPYLMPILRELLPPKVTIIDSGAAVAQQTENILRKNSLLNLKIDDIVTYKFYSNTNVQVLNKLINKDSIEVNYLDF